MEKRVTKNQKRAQEQALKKQRNRLVAGIILIAAALVIAVGGVLLFLQDQKKTDAVPDTSDYEQVLQSYYDALISADGKTMAQITAPPEYWPYYLETYDKTEADVEMLAVGCYDDYANQDYTIYNDVFSDNGYCAINTNWAVFANGTATHAVPGINWYNYTLITRPDENGLEEWNQNMESLLGNTGANISEAVTLEVEQTLSGSTKKGTETVYPTLAKMGDSWYIMETDNEKLQNPAGQSDSSSQS